MRRSGMTLAAAAFAGAVAVATTASAVTDLRDAADRAERQQAFLPPGFPTSAADWSRRPSAEQLAAARPAKAAAGASGVAEMDCAVSPTGTLSACKTTGELPDKAGFGKAALGLSSGFVLSPAAVARVGPRRVRVAVFFPAADGTSSPLVMPPELVRPPTPLDLKPYAALKGQASVDCRITRAGTAEDCWISREFPVDDALEQPALAVARTLAFRPQRRDGEPVDGGRLTFPVTFSRPGPDANPRQVFLPSVLVWDAAPSRAEVAEIGPAQGKVVLRCRVRPDGRMINCHALSETPQGLGDAAAELARRFRFVMASVDPAVVSTLAVDIPMTFGEPAPDVLAKADWIRALPEGLTYEVFPPKAADAGLKTGRAILDCVADAKGMMTACRVVSEDPAGMDFGTASLRVAKLMGVNPWTDEGLPAEGAHVKFALRLNQKDPASPPPAGQ